MFSVTECLHLKKRKIPIVRNPSVHLKKIENEGQIKSKANRRRKCKAKTRNKRQ